MGKSKSKSGGARNYTPLLTARPKGMSYQEYRERRAYQNAWLKERLKGFICYVSSELVVYDKITGLPRLFNHRTDDIHKANFYIVLLKRTCRSSHTKYHHLSFMA